MTGQLFWHPRLAEGCDSINARAAEANRAAEWAAAIDRCKQIIDDPRGYSDAQLREVCGFYMAYGDGGVHYLRADALIWAIERRRQVKVNEAKCRAALARIDDRDEKIARLAPPPSSDRAEHRRQFAALVLGGIAALALVILGGL